MANIPQGWSGDQTRISKLFTFDSFADAMTFMLRVSYHCESADHHPEWKNIYNKVWVELTTHDKGGVTDKDMALAEVCDRIAALLRAN